MSDSLPDEITSALVAVGFLQFALLAAGVRALWLTVLSGPARERARGPLPLAPWEIPALNFGCAILFVAMGGLFFHVQAAMLFGTTNLQDLLGGDAELALVLQGAVFQIGLLAGAAGARATVCRNDYSPPGDRPSPTSRPFRDGVVTFLAAMPVVTAINLAWQGVLTLFKVEAPPQELVFLMVEAESPLTSAILIGFAVIVAPLAEEIVFRAGLFRYLRTRVPRIVAYLLPAVIFGALHGNLAAFVPLTTLAVVFAFAYERTGRIAVPIVAHALFNLNTILLLFAGVAV